MFDIGWSELLLIGIVALIVVGPKDLPGMFRTLGRFTAKARSMGREFQRAMDDAARQSGVADTAADLKAMTSKKNLGLDALDQAASTFEKWKPGTAPTTSKGPTKGPATQALADKKAAEAAARTTAKAEKTAEKTTEKTGVTPAPKAKQPAPSKAKATTQPPAATTAVKTAAARPVRKPASAAPKKSDA